MKTTQSPLLVLVLCCLAAVLASPVSGQTISLKITNTITNSGTTETATREVDGLAITYPVDEADVVELLLPSIAKYRETQRAAAKAEADAWSEKFSSDELRETYRKFLPKLLGLEPAEDQGFDARYETAQAEFQLFIRRWEKWAGGLSHLTFWNKATAAGVLKDGVATFPEISYRAGTEDRKTEFTLRPHYLRQILGADLIRPPKGPGGGALADEAFGLDLPLFYLPGTAAETLAAQQRELLGELPKIFEKLCLSLIAPAQQGLSEELLQSEIGAHYFTAAATATPKGALLVRALARYYFMVQLKSAGKMAGDAEGSMMSQLFAFDLPKGAAARAEFQRDFEALDPFSEDAQEKLAASDDLAFVGSRFAAFAMVNMAQGSEDHGMPVFQKLRGLQQVPGGGFATVAAFRQALEAAYPGQVDKILGETRQKFSAAIRERIARETPPAAASVAAKPEPPAAEVPPLPDRQTKVFAGVTVTYPASLTAAVAKLGPEWAGRIAEARAKVDERFAPATVPPVAIADGTLTMLRGQSLPVTREKADQFALQASVVANAGQMIRGLFNGNAVQVWFKSDLKALLKEGRAVPGFTYEPKDDIVSYRFDLAGHITMEKGQAIDLKSLTEAMGKSQPVVFPVVVKEDDVARLTDLDAQVAKLREADAMIGPMLESAARLEPSQLGGAEPSLFHGGVLRPAQALFASVHELVEDDVTTRVIASADRRWFCEGLANLMAQRACETQFGPDGDGAPGQVFAALYDSAALSRRVAEVDLLNWVTEENRPADAKVDDELVRAHYYYATRVLMAATAGRGDDFVKTWLEKIHETSWNRTNAGTIFAAYETLTGKSLREIMKATVAAAP